MLISYVIPSKASSPKLLALFEDFTRQLVGIDDVEVVVVVNGVDDWGILENSTYLKSEGAIRCFRAEKAGAHQGRMRAAHESQGIYLWLLDDDVRLPDGFVANSRKFLKANPGDFGGAPIHLFPGRTLPDWVNRPEIYRWLTLDDPRADFAAQNSQWNPFANAYVRRDAFLSLEQEIECAPYELGRKKGSLLSGEDTDVWYRLHRRGSRHANCNEALVYHDVHLDRLSEEWFLRRADMESISLWCRLRNYGLPTFFREIVRKTPGIIFSSARYFLMRHVLGQNNLAHALHYRERTAFLPFFFQLLLARPLTGTEPQ